MVDTLSNFFLLYSIPRGTASKLQMDDNLNYTLRPCDFGSWNTATLDALDGLSVPSGKNGIILPLKLCFTEA